MEIPTGFAQVNWHFGGLAAPTSGETTLGIDHHLTGDTPEDVLQTVADAFGASNFFDNFSTQIQVVRMSIKFGPTATGPSAELATAFVGTFGAQAVAPNTSVLIRKGTAFGGRAGRGRMYWPGVSESSVDSAGVVDSTLVDDLNTTIEAFVAALVLGDIQPVLLHGDGSPLTTPSPLTSMSADSRAATQRRRLRR